MVYINLIDCISELISMLVNIIMMYSYTMLITLELLHFYTTDWPPG